MVDGTKVMARSPIGMKGARLSVECIFITCLEQHIVDLVAAVEEAGMEVEDIVASPLAASFVAQSKMQKRVGSVLVNIGAETLSMIVFDEMVPLSVKVFPVGSSDITNDLALGLRVSPEEAEQLKHGAVLGAPYSKKKIDEMVNSRVTALFKIVESHLQKLGKSELLPGGVIITGGTASLTSVADIAKQVLKLPSRVASLADDTAKGTKNSLRDGSWTVAYGLTIWGLTQQTPTNTVLRAMPGGDLWRALLRYIKKFLP